MNIKKLSLKVIFVSLFLFFTVLPSVFAVDTYKPYLHEAQVPEHPKVKLYGSYSTNLFPGSATYTYPIEVPIGTNGLQPSLTVSYSSQSVKQRPGILGAGWSLSQNYIYRDVNSTPGNIADDEFKLIFNGASYDLIYDSSDGLYHTKVESFLRIQNLTGGSNTYSNYWLVTSKDGTKFRFGFNSDSELTSNTGKSYALRWSLDKVEDTHGNKIYYTYFEDPNAEDKGTTYLSQILYNNDQKRKIEFIYETSARPDRRLVYDQGNQLDESRRLSDIRVLANDVLVRRYNFEYVNLNVEHSLSSISKINFYGSDSTSLLQQISFEYHTANTGFTKYSATEWIPPTSFSDDDDDFGVRAIDLNNDGFVDLIKGRQSTSEKKAWINNKNNNWTDTTDWAPPIFFTEPKSYDELVKACIRTGYGSCTDAEWNRCYYDKCFAWGNECGSGTWYTYWQIMCVADYLNNYDTNTVDIDNGVKFADFDNDGFVDILQSNSTAKKAWINNQNGWTDVSGTWAPPIDFFVDSKDKGVQLVDFNGDGRVDILQSYYSGSPTKKAYINNGTGWTDVSSTWQVPAYFIYNDGDGGARIEDVNGDGLPDIVESFDNGTVSQNVWLNSGNGWTISSTWMPPVLFIKTGRTDEGVRFADVNGDGLVDILQALTNSSGTFKSTWINNGNGWVLNNSWEAPEVFISNGVNMGRRLTDINGDGLVDMIIGQTNSSGSFYWSWIKNPTTPYMLKKVTNEFGGVISVNYQESTRFNNNGTDNSSDLGFNVWVVKNVSQNNSMSGVFNTLGNYSYNFSGGKYDYKNFEFRGFNQVNETRPDNSLAIHYFYQSDALKGNEYKTEIYNSSGNPYSKDEYVYANTSQNGYFKVLLTGQASYLYDGSSSNPKVANVSYSYDSYGNVVERVFLGDNSTSGDEKYEQYSYVYNTSAWIVDRLSRYSLYSSDNNTKVKDVKYSYDGKSYGSNTTKGDITQIINWNDNGADSSTSYTYDSYGNVLTQTDPRGYVTTYSYGLKDTTFTYPDRVTNALGHTTDYQYNFGTGNLLWYKQNDITTYFYYDVFGRIIKEVQPYDSYELPTKNYSYSFDGISPESIKASSRTTTNKTFDVYYFYDGFANFVQLKRPADGNQQIVKNLFYDSLGRVKSEQNPYFSSFSTSLTIPSTTVKNTTYIYDSLSRAVRIDNPDSTNKTIAFNHRTITAYDENGHKKAYILDTYDRITTVQEFNNDPILNLNYETDVYNTSYEYDTADNLIRIVDNVGNTYSFTYDSLGRRIQLIDPDIGTWTYTYDLSGNLISQKQQGGGNLVTGDGYYREYDGLNQLIRIKNGSTVTSPVLENYSYDPFGQRIKIMRNDSARTVIYTPFKEIMRIINSTGTYDFTYIYQDGVLVAKVNPDGSKYYYHPDNLGSTTLITNQSGNVVENTFYNPYGELLGGGSADVKLYTGQMKDFPCQYYYGRRYFSPCWGIFIQPDTLIQKVYDPQSLNHYSYAWNNPYKYFDSSGLAVTAVNEIDEIEIILYGSRLTAPVERTYIYEDDTKVGYIQSGGLTFYSSSSMTYAGRYTVGTTTNVGYDYTVTLGSNRVASPTISTYNPPIKFVPTGETKQLSSIIKQNQQSREVRRLGKLGEAIISTVGELTGVGGSVKYVAYTAKTIGYVQTAYETSKQAAETIKNPSGRNIEKTGWEALGAVPFGIGTIKSWLDVFFYESDVWVWDKGLNPFESINNCKCG